MHIVNIWHYKNFYLELFAIMRGWHFKNGPGGGVGVGVGWGGGGRGW